MKQIYQAVFIAAITIGIFSCSKKDDSTSTTPPNNGDSSNQIDPIKLANKWETNGILTYLYDKNHNVTGIQGYSKTLQHDGIFWADSLESYITFKSDNTYSITHADGTSGGAVICGIFAANGSWAAADSNKAITMYINGVGNYDLKVASFSDHYLNLVDTFGNADSSWGTHFIFTR